MKDLSRLEHAFKEAVAGLPNYKRSAAWEYVKALEERAIEKDREISVLADRVIELENEITEAEEEIIKTEGLDL